LADRSNLPKAALWKRWFSLSVNGTLHAEGQFFVTFGLQFTVSVPTGVSALLLEEFPK
jgi:hypothetical protein